MTQRRTKILPRFNVPVGGITFKFIASTGGGHYNTDVIVTVASAGGDFYVSGDNQSDDFLFRLQTDVDTAIAAAGLTGSMYADIEPDTHKVRLAFVGSSFVNATGDNDVRVPAGDWSKKVRTALGWKNETVTSASYDNPAFTSNYHHGYGFYCDEDGQTEDFSEEDIPSAETVQARSHSGRVVTQQISDHLYNATLKLQFLERNKKGRTKVFSGNEDYGDNPPYPYNVNEPLECFWRAVITGSPFRVYDNSFLDTAKAQDIGTKSAHAATTLTDAAKSWTIDPEDQHKGYFLYVESFVAAASTLSQGFYITSHTDTVITVPNAHPSGDSVGGTVGDDYAIFANTYGTYVLDQSGGEKTLFDPKETRQGLDRWNIEIPLLRYIS